METDKNNPLHSPKLICIPEVTIYVFTLHNMLLTLAILQQLITKLHLHKQICRTEMPISMSKVKIIRHVYRPSCYVESTKETI